MLKTSLAKLMIGKKEDVEKPTNPGRIPSDLLKVTRAKRRAFVDARREENVIEHVIKLPAEDETMHLIIDGRYTPADIVPSIRRLSDPAVISELYVMTLGLDEDNVSMLCRGMDAKKILACTLIVSHYFRSAERPLFEFTKQEIEQRGGRVRGLRTHCKIILLKMSDGRCFTVEGSANLRSCKSVEQLAITNSPALLEFHKGWIEDFIESSKQK